MVLMTGFGIATAASAVTGTARAMPGAGASIGAANAFDTTLFRFVNIQSSAA